MRIFETKWFARFARKEGLSDADLLAAIRDAERGLIAADLGGGVIKQRIAGRGKGKSGGYRAIVLFRAGDKAFFAYGFAKDQRDNVRKNELEALKALAVEMLGYDDGALTNALRSGAIVEVGCDEENVLQ